MLEMKTDKKGKAKVRHRGGWTPMKAPDGRAVMEPVSAPQQPAAAPAPAQAPAPAEAPAPAPAPAPPPMPEEDEHGELPFKLLKGPQGFGINIDDRGVVIGYTGTGGPAELAGVPVGTLLVRVNGESTGSDFIAGDSE